MQYLQSVRLKRGERLPAGYPFELPVVHQLEAMTFDAPVTFFVGENGAGKSTMLEAIAAAANSITIGGVEISNDVTLVPARALADRLTLSWCRRTHRGFFMRAEDFFNYATRMADEVVELENLASAYEQDRRGDWQRARGMALGQRGALVRRYGENLDARSHGESFIHLFQERFVPGGLYLLDEPDTALSPQRQLALLAMLKAMVADNAQFIIATHSSILLALPDASILSFDDGRITRVAYDEVTNVQLSRGFLADPDAYLRHL